MIILCAVLHRVAYCDCMTGKLTVDSFTTILGIDSKHVDANMLIQVLDSNKIGYVDFQSFTT